MIVSRVPATNDVMVLYVKKKQFQDCLQDKIIIGLSTIV